MAKKGKKKSKKETAPAEAVGAVRTAVERTFQATAGSAQSTRTRAQDLVDEVAGAAGRVREMIEDIRVLEDLKGLRTEMEALSRRVAALESAPEPKPKPAARRTASRSTSSRSTASRSTAKRSTAKRKPATTKASGSSRSTAAKKRSA
jgi:DNA-binding protein HU-beta